MQVKWKTAETEAVQIRARMQIFLLTLNRTEVSNLNCFHFISQTLVQTEWAFLETKMANIYWRNGIQMCVYDDVKGWNTFTLSRAGEFYLEFE
jgi:hypothetical protein